MDKINCIDLFAGAGGLSEGFAKCGVLPLAHVEVDSAAAYTLRTRAVFHYLKNHDMLDIYHSYLLGNISRKDLYSRVPTEVLDSVINAKIGPDNERIFAQIDRLKNGSEIDIIIGGPPCQAYSIVGIAALKHKVVDERKTLYKEYGKFLERYKPRVFLFENVPGLLSSASGMHFENLKSYYREIGYSVEAKVLNALSFGVVQNRSRVIIIGWRNDFNFDYPEFGDISVKPTRDDIFLDLPAVGANEKKRWCHYADRTNEYLEAAGIRNCVSYVTQHVTRPHNPADLAIYKLAIQQLHQGHRLKNDKIPEKMRTQKNVTSFLDRFKVVDSTPHTMIAHISKDGHHYIHPDEKQLRSISIREAARIQSFPDDYFFEGTKEGVYRSAAFRQIGNAVPPLMAASVAERIKSMLSRTLSTSEYSAPN